jgi:hypothetical protein
VAQVLGDDMKVLYLSTNFSSEQSEHFGEINQYEVVKSTSFEDALRLLKTTCFDALVIDDRGDPATVQFVVDTRVVRPHLPVFVISAWGADLDIALNSIAVVKQVAACR